MPGAPAALDCRNLCAGPGGVETWNAAAMRSVHHRGSATQSARDQRAIRPTAVALSPPAPTNDVNLPSVPTRKALTLPAPDVRT